MTFSLLAFDRASEATGICSVTSSPAHGQRCLHFRPGVGIVATQGKTNRYHGMRGLELLSCGMVPEACLNATLREERRKAAFTGERNRDFKGHVLCEEVVAAGNHLVCNGVLQAMIDGFRDAKVELADRLLAGVKAGEMAGGERGGSRSGFLVVVRSDQMQPWGADVDIRIDYAADVIPAMVEALAQYRSWESERLHDPYSTLDGNWPTNTR